MSIAKILWVDDEIDSLTSQIMFLENKGYQVQTKTNGFDAIEFVKENIVDVVLMDESMPGLTGLQTLQQIKEVNSNLPVVLITKNEAENLMDEAIGSQISDYLIKPVNPNQVWLSLKKLIDNKRLVAEKTTSAYQQDFRSLFMALSDNPDYNGWLAVHTCASCEQPGAERRKQRGRPCQRSARPWLRQGVWCIGRHRRVRGASGRSSCQGDRCGHQFEVANAGR